MQSWLIHLLFGHHHAEHVITATGDHTSKAHRPNCKHQLNIVVHSLARHPCTTIIATPIVIASICAEKHYLSFRTRSIHSWCHVQSKPMTSATIETDSQCTRLSKTRARNLQPILWLVRRAVESALCKHHCTLTHQTTIIQIHTDTRTILFIGYPNNTTLSIGLNMRLSSHQKIVVLFALCPYLRI